MRKATLARRLGVGVRGGGEGRVWVRVRVRVRVRVGVRGGGEGGGRIRVRVWVRDRVRDRVRDAVGAGDDRDALGHVPVQRRLARAGIGTRVRVIFRLRVAVS